MYYSVHPLLSAVGGGGGGMAGPNVQKGGSLAWPPFLEGGCWERGGDVFQGGCNFLTKNNLKSGMFNDKKS